MIININSAQVQRDYGCPGGDSPTLQHGYPNDGQYPCQTYPEELYHQYPPQPYTSGTSSEFCETWTNNHRFFVNNDVNYHASASSARVDSFFNPNPLETSDSNNPASFCLSGNHNRHQQQHHQQHHQPSHYYPMTSPSDVNGVFRPHEMTSAPCREKDGSLLMVQEKLQQDQAGQMGSGALHSKSDCEGQGLDPHDPARLGATERERTRMHMLNDAFDDLRKVRII